MNLGGDRMYSSVNGGGKNYFGEKLRARGLSVLCEIPASRDAKSLNAGMTERMKLICRRVVTRKKVYYAFLLDPR
jgi:hypothetical protein